FADTLLKPHLAQHQVFMHNPILIAHARRKGRVHRGGGRSYLPMKDDILRFLKQEKTQDVFFTTMIDLYAISPDFPGLADSEKFRQDPMQRVKFLEQRFAEDIGDCRLIPYIQLHEYEAYLLADPTCFNSLYAGCSKEIEFLTTIVSQYESPELINDGPHTAPSKRIASQFSDYSGAKTAQGPLLAERIGLDQIRARCPHFNTWLSKLEELGSSIDQ
ncbi:MAG: DUF4276 family protein, partial [Leptolyngbya sp. SIO4C1]|nr:DUF4276 family protein [Leptolyngbya sp. SIO4C1]